MNKDYIVLAVVIPLIISVVAVALFVGLSHQPTQEPSPTPTPTPSPNPDPEDYKETFEWVYPLTTLTIEPHSYSRKIDLTSESKYAYESTAWANATSTYIFDGFGSRGQSEFSVKCPEPSTFYLYIGNTFHSEIKGEVTLTPFNREIVYFGNPTNETLTINLRYYEYHSYLYLRSDLCGGYWFGY